MKMYRTRRKLIKLLENPRRFVQDSGVVRLAGALPWSALQTLRIAPVGPRIAPRSAALKLEQLYEYLADGAHLFVIDGDSVAYPIVACVRTEWMNLIAQLLSFCSREEVGLAYSFSKGFTTVHRARELYDVLRGQSHVLLRLDDQRSDDTLHVEFQAWQDLGSFLLAPRPNHVAHRAWRRALDSHNLPRRGSVGRLNEILPGRTLQEVPFEVDFVYSWVNNEDPAWREMFAKHRPCSERDGTSLARFYNRDELRFSLRALDRYAPWVRRIHIVSNCAPPAWLDTEHPRITWVDHSEIFEPECLPTFSSHAIEARLHRVPELTNHFVYSNDDFLLTRPTTKADFFESNGLCRLKLEQWGSVNGPPDADDPDYINGARNAQQLLERDFGVSPTQLHCHAPQALRVDVLAELEHRYADQFQQTASQKFRSVTDLAVTGFLFHHYAYVTGRAMQGDEPTMLIQQNHRFDKSYRRLLEQRSERVTPRRILSVCVNDGKDSHLNTRWNQSTMRFLELYFDRKSEFER